VPVIYLPEEQAIRVAFARVRHSAPCLMVLEDLDALIKAQHRSMLLNELDGFAANTGIVTLATTSHPERLDPALIDRPSRFDRKYHFELPGRPERLAYILRWNATLQLELRISESCAETVVDGTQGFSYAYLKELFLSSTMRWLALPEAGVMDLVIDEQMALPRVQLTSTKRGEHKAGKP
jgi:AAA+ superfamily predicted ATPase